MITPSEGFVRTLEALDPLLSVRWGHSIGQWVIARKAHVGKTELRWLGRRRERLERWARDPNHPQLAQIRSTLAGVIEEHESMKEGKRVILFAKELSPQIYNSLCMSDMQRYGGYSRYADELEQDEARRAADQQRIQENEINAINKEAFDQLNFIWRKKETKLLRGERDMNVLLHGEKRNVPPIESELIITG